MDTGKTYRNIYIKEGIQPQFRGDNLVYYTGKVVFNAPETLVTAEYNRSSDAYITCGCDFSTIKALIKKN
jgi:hypothetical protein